MHQSWATHAAAEAMHALQVHQPTCAGLEVMVQVPALSHDGLKLAHVLELNE